MPAGGTDGRYAYPSVSSWELILRELRASLGASLCFVGKLRRDERSSTSFERWELDRLLGSFPGSVDAFDCPLVEQLALVEACALFLSPHTGFGMAFRPARQRDNRRAGSAPRSESVDGPAPENVAHPSRWLICCQIRQPCPDTRDNQACRRRKGVPR